MLGRYERNVCKVLQECLEVVLKVSGWCLNDHNASKRFIGGVQTMFIDILHLLG